MKRRIEDRDMKNIEDMEPRLEQERLTDTKTINGFSRRKTMKDIMEKRC